ARLGGDEFALLLPDTGAAEASSLLGRLHRLLSPDRMCPSISMSVGAATFVRPPRDIDRMVRRVDALMYRAKNGGKNRVEHEEIIDLDPQAPATRVERRAAARVLCNRSVRITGDGPGCGVDQLARVIDISTNGIGLVLSGELPMH